MSNSHNEKTNARDVMREHGLRYSKPREVILDFLLEADKHVTAESLYMGLKNLGEEISLSTVYLNLTTLTQAGLLLEFRGANGQTYYDSNIDNHFHVVCRETGDVLDVPEPVINGLPLGEFLKQTIEAATGWKVDDPQLSLTGLSPVAKQQENS